MLIMMIAAGSGSSSPEISKHSILHINLDGSIEERAQGKSLIDELQGIQNNSIPLNDLIKSIRHAATDSKIDGIYLECNGGSAEELAKFKESGKWIVAYGDAYSQGNYYLASVADSLWLNPIGNIDIHGLGGSTPYFKGLLDKLGVEAQVIKVGTYKSAVEPYIMTGPSEANIQQIPSGIT